MAKKIMLVAGEASGDLHGASLVKALRELSPDLEIMGIGGTKMEEAGVKILFDISQMAIVGFAEVLSQFKKLRRIFLKTCRVIDEEKIDALVLIDYPGFNLRLAARAREMGVPIIYYISPQVWAWGRGRVKRIARLVDKMLVIFSFETKIYQDEGLSVEFVGHPLLDVLGKREVRREEIAADLGIPLDRPIVGILPGSRKQEVSRLLPIMLKAAKLMGEKKPLRFILPCASTVSSQEIESILDPKLEVKLVADQTYRMMTLADVLLVASGTATLEAACLGAPMVIIYKVSLLNWLLVRPLIKVPNLGLVNVVAGRKVVPEFLQFEAQPRRIASAALNLLEDSGKREQMKKELRAVRAELGQPGASRRAARLILEMMEAKT